MYIFIFLFTFCIQVEPFDINNNLADKPAACKYFKRTAKPLEDDALKKSTDIGEKVNNKNEENHNSCCENCGLMRFGIVQKIIYSNANDAEDVSFSSACVRCGLCLAIADKMNKTLIDVHDDLPPDLWLNNTEVHILFGIICNESFVRYRLREINGERYIGESYPGSILIGSTANGLWEKNLRKKCNELIEDVGGENLYNYWKDWYAGFDIKFRNILCRGDVGILRECRSFKDVRDLSSSKQEEEEESEYGIQINAKLECTYD